MHAVLGANRISPEEFCAVGRRRCFGVCYRDQVVGLKPSTYIVDFHFIADFMVRGVTIDTSSAVIDTASCASYGRFGSDVQVAVFGSLSATGNGEDHVGQVRTASAMQASS